MKNYIDEEGYKDDDKLMSIKPFIVPAKGFGYDEVLSLIQRLVNNAKK